jgi:hypothetical protein
MSDTEIAEWARFFIDGKKEIEHLKISIKVRDGSNTHLYKRLRSFASRLKMKEKENEMLLKKLAFIKRGLLLIDAVYSTMDDGDEKSETLLDNTWTAITDDLTSVNENK